MLDGSSQSLRSVHAGNALAASRVYGLGNHGIWQIIGMLTRLVGRAEHVQFRAVEAIITQERTEALLVLQRTYALV